METTSAHFKSWVKEPLLRQLLKVFERNSAKNVPNSLITLVGMSSDFEIFFLCLRVVGDACRPLSTHRTTEHLRNELHKGKVFLRFILGFHHKQCASD